VSADEFLTPEEKSPATQDQAAGGPPDLPPRPPKLTARDLLDPEGSNRNIFLWDYVVVRDLAELLGQKPLKVVADILEMRKFKHADEFIDFATAERIARKYGFTAKRFIE